VDKTVCVSSSKSKYGDTTRMTKDMTLWCHSQKYQTITNFIMDGNKGNN
jgi:hypothetical protein